jgi:hypothetical protein
MRMDDFSGLTSGYIDINPTTNPQITLSDGLQPTELNLLTLNNNEINNTNTNTSFKPLILEHTNGSGTITATWTI